MAVNDTRVAQTAVRVLRAGESVRANQVSTRVLRAGNSTRLTQVPIRIIYLNRISIDHSADVVTFFTSEEHAADILVVSRVELSHQADIYPSRSQQHLSDVLVGREIFLHWALKENGSTVASGSASQITFNTFQAIDWSNYQHTLSSGEANAITDYENLKIEFRSIGAAAISWVELQVPNALRLTQTHLADLLVDSQALGHGMDVWLQAFDTPVPHSADVIASVRGDQSHSADLFLATRVLETHSADVYPVRASIHQADVLLKAVVSVEHSADLITQGDGIIHDADVYMVLELHGSTTFEVGPTITAAGGTETTGSKDTAKTTSVRGKRRKLGRRKI